MSFNKRYFDMNLFADYYEEDKINGVSNCIGKTEIFIFQDNESREVVDLWENGKKQEANKLIQKHVSRITSEIS